MKVFENIESYDPAAVICLSPEDDERFVEELKRVVTDLIPLRANKRKTRQYFDKYLRLDDNIGMEEATKNYFSIKDKYDNGYCPIPGEVKWPSRCFQPALFDVLKSDYTSFGYVVNILSAEIGKRHPNSSRAGYSVPDDIVKFSLKYDIEEIENSLKKINSPADRLIFLNATVAQLKIDLESIYADWYSFAEDYLTKLDIIIDRETKRQDLLLKKLQEDDPFFSSEPNLDERRKTFLISREYELNKESFISAIKMFLEEAYVGPNDILNVEPYDRTVLGIREEFRLFVTLTFKTEEQDTLKLVNSVRDWHQLIKECLEYAYSERKTCKIESVDYSTGTEIIGVSEKDTLPVVKMLLEETGIICTGYIAKLLYAHRDGKEVLFVAWGGGVERFMKRREELIHDFGKLEERKRYTEVDANFSVYYERMMEIGKSALIECLKKTFETDLRLRTSESAGRLTSWVTQMQESYVKLAHNDEIPFDVDYFESYMWTYVACYCAKSVFIAIEKAIATHHCLSLKCDYEGFQYFDLVVVPEIFNSILYNFKCKDEDQSYADALNELFSLHIEKKDPVIPSFDNKQIGADFISDSEWSNNCPKNDIDAKIDRIAEFSITKAEEARVAAIYSSAKEEGLEIVDIGDGAHIIRLDTKKEDDVRSTGRSNDDQAQNNKQQEQRVLSLKFFDGVSDEVKVKICKYLRANVGKEPGVDEMIYFRALLDANIMPIPEYKNMVSEFPAYATAYKNFNYYLGYSGIFRKNLSIKHTKIVDNLLIEIRKIIE